MPRSISRPWPAVSDAVQRRQEGSAHPAGQSIGMVAGMSLVAAALSPAIGPALVFVIYGGLTLVSAGAPPCCCPACCPSPGQEGAVGCPCRVASSLGLRHGLFSDGVFPADSLAFLMKDSITSCRPVLATVDASVAELAGRNQHRPIGVWVGIGSGRTPLESSTSPLVAVLRADPIDH